MLKKIRIKFIAIIMVLSTLVITLAFGTVCYLEYQRATAEVCASLDESITHASNVIKNSALPNDQPKANDPSESGQFAENLTEPVPAEDPLPENSHQNGSGSGIQKKDGTGPKIGGRGDGRANLLPAAIYSINSDGTYTEVDEATTAEISNDVLDSAMQQAISDEDGFGDASSVGLVYMKRHTESGTLVAFVDHSYADGWRTLMRRLFAICLITLAVFFAISLYLSKWALNPVKEALERQKQFVVDASHELKTPLTVVLANMSILLKHPEMTIASQSKWIESTQIEAQNMEGLVSEMLTLAQIESHATSIRESVDFSDMLNMEILQFESVAFESGFDLESNIKDNVVINADRERIRKMSSTLIENASKYVNNGGTVKVSLSANEKTATMTVFNTGSYIPPESIEHVFDRFYRADKARTSGAGGFGLGLAIAREIARESGGEIVVESVPDKGTTFTATISIN